MTGLWAFTDFVLVAGGYVACWYTKDMVAKAFMGASDYAKALEAKLNAAKAAMK